MKRKPVDQQQPSECREAIWQWIRRHTATHGPVAEFSHGDVDVKLSLDSIRDYLAGLCNAGYLGKCDESINKAARRAPIAYYLKNDCGNEAPRVHRDGTPIIQGQGRRNMWNAMRILKRFSPGELAFNSSTEVHAVTVSEAAIYCRALCKAGYLAENPKGLFILIMAMWTGPHPPQIQRTRQVYDPNLRRVVWSRVEGGAE